MITIDNSENIYIYDKYIGYIEKSFTDNLYYGYSKTGLSTVIGFKDKEDAKNKVRELFKNKKNQ